MLNVWMWADVGRGRHVTRAVELARIATPATVVTDIIVLRLT